MEHKYQVGQHVVITGETGYHGFQIGAIATLVRRRPEYDTPSEGENWEVQEVIGTLCQTLPICDFKPATSANLPDRRSQVSDVQKGQENLGVDVYKFSQTEQSL